MAKEKLFDEKGKHWATIESGGLLPSQWSDVGDFDNQRPMRRGRVRG